MTSNQSDEKYITFSNNILYCIEQNRNVEAQAYFANYDPSQFTDRDNFTFLHYAVCYNNDTMIKYFLRKGCNIDAVDVEGYTPLMHAVEQNNSSIVKILLDERANIFLRTRAGKSVFQIVIKYLTDIDKDIIDMIFGAAKAQCSYNNQILAIKLLQIELALPEIIPFRDINLTNLMLRLSNCLKIQDCYGNTALHYAVELEDYEHVAMFVDKKIAVELKNEERQGPLHFYNTKSEDTEDKRKILEILLNYGENFGCKGPFGNYMLDAKLFYSGSKQLIEKLMHWNVDFNSKDVNNRTLIHVMSANENLDIADILRNIKINDINDRDNLGRTALWYAVNVSNPAILQVLLEKGADVNIVDTTEQTVIFYGLTVWPMYPKNSESMRCLELLLQYKANAQYMCMKDQTIFHIFLRMLTRFELVYIVIAHLTMMQALGTPINNDILTKINNNRQFLRYYNECKREITSMMNVFVYESVTLFELMTESKKKLASHLRNSQLLRTLERMFNYVKDNKCIIDHYERVYWKRLVEAHKHAKLRKPAGTVLARVLKQLNSVDCIIDEILDNLDYRDLENICAIKFD